MRRAGFALLAFVLVLLLGAVAARADCRAGGCHAQLGKKAYPHAPVEENCLDCHVAVTKSHPAPGKKEKSFKLVAEGAALCAQCHDPFGEKKVVHDPVKDGDCLACHKVHGADHPHLLDVGGNLSELCFGCHDADAFRKEFEHGPAAVGACTSCHDPHASEEKALLKKPVRTTCLGCHSDFNAHLQAAPVVHDPVKEDPCTDCHDPHAAAVRYVLNEKMPDLCFGCHAEIGDKVAKVKVGHAPVRGSGSCANCHSAHVSKTPSLLPAAEETVCLGCHGRDDLGKPPLKNIAKQLAPVVVERGGKKEKQQKHLHGPLKEGRCSACHEPHGSDNFRMLTGPYPAGIYAPYRDGTYGFCLQCHEKNLLRFADTTLYTNFRNGSRNLHVVHVADKRKGRTCRMCHEPHASVGPKLISKQGVPFGEWRIPIRFRITPTGGSCAPGCHKALSYDREKPVTY